MRTKQSEINNLWENYWLTHDKFVQAIGDTLDVDELKWSFAKQSCSFKEMGKQIYEWIFNHNKP